LSSGDELTVGRPDVNAHMLACAGTHDVQLILSVLWKTAFDDRSVMARLKLDAVLSPKYREAEERGANGEPQAEAFALVGQTCS
jgi:hypothetical protein